MSKMSKIKVEVKVAHPKWHWFWEEEFDTEYEVVNINEKKHQVIKTTICCEIPNCDYERLETETSVKE